MHFKMSSAISFNLDRSKIFLSGNGLNDKKLLKVFFKYNKKYLNNLVTGDETWIYYFEPKCKCSNTVWATRNALRPSTAERQPKVKKVLHVIFF